MPIKKKRNKTTTKKTRHVLINAVHGVQFAIYLFINLTVYTVTQWYDMCSRYRGKQITVSYLIELVGETKVTTITKDNNNNKRITIQTMRSREDPSAQA